MVISTPKKAKAENNALKIPYESPINPNVSKGSGLLNGNALSLKRGNVNGSQKKNAYNRKSTTSVTPNHFAIFKTLGLIFSFIIVVVIISTIGNNKLPQITLFSNNAFT